MNHRLVSGRKMVKQKLRPRLDPAQPRSHASCGGKGIDQQRIREEVPIALLDGTNQNNLRRRIFCQSHSMKVEPMGSGRTLVDSASMNITMNTRCWVTLS